MKKKEMKKMHNISTVLAYVYYVERIPIHLYEEEKKYVYKTKKK